MVRELSRIADALETQNQLLEAGDPDAARRLRRPDLEPSDTAVDYVDPQLVQRAQLIRAQVYEVSGKVLDDEELLEYMSRTELGGRS
jgi:hypothetical protein